jgi:hypothetical protein
MYRRDSPITLPTMPDARSDFGRDSQTDPLASLAALEGVGSAMVAARDGIDALLRDRGLRRTTPELTTESLLLGAQASATLDGSASTLPDVRAGDGDALAQAALRVSTELLGLVPVLARSPLQVFARLHTLAAAGDSAEADLGRPRDPAAAQRLRELARVLSSPTTAPALVAAAVVHAEINTAAPFTSHNGIVARAAERVVLVARGVDPPSLTVPEAGHLRLRREYESNLRAYATGGSSGVHSWLLYAAEAYTAGAQASPARG